MQLGNVELCEFVNKSKLLSLIDSGLLKEEWTQEDVNKKHKWFNTHRFKGENEALRNYYNNLDENGMIQIAYKKDSNQGRHKLSNCLSSMKRIYRNYLLCDDYYDFDMVNSCATILLHLGTLNNSKNLRCLKLYVNNRQKWFNKIKKEFKCDDKQAKSLMTALTFGANLNFKDEELVAYKNSLQYIQNELKETHLYDFIETEKSGLSWTAILIQTIEDKIVIDLLNHLILNYPQLVHNKFSSIPNAIYELDGFKLSRENVDNFGGENAVIKIINEWLNSNSYNTISFISKSMDEKINLVVTNEISTGQLKNDLSETSSPTEINNTFSPIIITPHTHQQPHTQINTDVEDKQTEIKNKQTEIDTLELVDLKEFGASDKLKHKTTLVQRKTEMRDLKNDLKKLIKQQKEQQKLDKQNEINERKNQHLFVDSNDEAIDIIINRLESSFIYVRRQMYVKCGHKWICDDVYVDNMLLKYILESEIYQSNPEFRLIPYCQNIPTAKNIRLGVLSKLCILKNDDNLYAKFHSSTKNKLCFNDGVLDFIEKKFVRWNDVPENTIYTTVIIDRNFENYFYNPNRHFINAIESDIMQNLFGDKTELALKFFARAITGNVEDKNFMSYCGNRDCGKGILFALFKSSFKEYVASFNLENITCKRESNKSSDLAKENAWLLPLQFVRFAISQETDDNENNDIKDRLKISNKMLKSIVSGGDELKARPLYKNEIEFNIDCTLGSFGNSEISISGNDGSKHHLKFSGVKTFVSKEEYDNIYNKFGEAYMSSYSIKDETLKEKVKSDDYANALIMLLYDNFINQTISVINDDDDENSYLPIRASIFKIYEITGNDKDKVSKDELLENVSGDKKKITAELKQLGCVGNDKCRTTIKYKDDKGIEKSKQVQAFKGLKLKVAIDEDEIENIE